MENARELKSAPRWAHLVHAVRRTLADVCGGVTLVLAPPRCLACAALVACPEPPAVPIAWCAACAAGVVPLGERLCLDCPAGEARRSCAREPHLRLLAAVQYGDAVAALVRATKYQGWVGLLDTWLAIWQAACGETPRAPRPDLLVPVPVHGSRERERGFALPGLWAERLGAWHGIPWADALARQRATRPQVGLDREARRRNVAGAFAAGPAWRAAAARRVALVDDVATSGATAREAVDLLRCLGARSVELWCFAHESLE